MNVTFHQASIIQKLQRAAYQGVKKAATMLQTEITESLERHASNIMNGGVASSPGSPPGRNTGTLSNSIQLKDVTQDPRVPHYVVGTSVPYARIQEFGGRIYPKRSQNLIIPIGKRGRDALKSCGGDIRSLKLRFIMTRRHTKILGMDLEAGHKLPWRGGGKKVKNDTFIPLFVLKRFVILPPRPYFRPAYAKMKAAMEAAIVAEMRKVMDKEAA